MPLIFRDTKGAPLTSAEGDANIRRLDAGKDVTDLVTPGPLSWTMNRLAGYVAAFIIATSGLKRWQFGATADAESGTNAGSNWFLDAYADNGTTILGRAMSVVRSTLAVTFGGGAVSIDGATATAKFMQFTTAGSARWRFQSTNTVESGTSVGSDLSIGRYDNTGAIIDNPILVNRNTGQTTLSVRPLFGTSVPWDKANLAQPATLSGPQTFTGQQTIPLLQVNASFSTIATSNSAQLWSTGTLAGLAFVTGNNTAAAQLIFTSGAFAFVNFNNTAYASLTVQTLTQASDKDLKTDIASYNPVLSRLTGKRIVSYRMLTDDTNIKQVGVIAQEWETDFPELVVETSVEIESEGVKRKALGFNYGNAAAVSLQGVIELQLELNAALERITALENK